MDALELFLPLGVALAIGLLVGLERERAAPEQAEKIRFFRGGIRTYPLFSLAGAVSVLVGPAAFLLTFGSLLVYLAVSYRKELEHGQPGLTSEAALTLTFLLGALTTSDDALPDLRQRLFTAASLAVVATLLLSLKPTLHRFAAKVSREDLYATVKFLIVAVVILPLLPNVALGPLDAINPFAVGLMVVFISGVSFAGYVAVRALGAKRGLGLTGVIGGLVSSTAVTLSMAGRAKEEPGSRDACAMAVVLASTIMLVRMVVLVQVVNPSLLSLLLVPAGAMTVAGAIVSGLLWRRAQHRGDEVQVAFANPFELGAALKFAAFFTVVLVGSKAAGAYFGAAGSYAAAALAGLADVDAITLSMARLARGSLDPHVAVTAMAIGAASNTLVKGGLSLALGGPAFGRVVFPALTLVLAAGAAGVAFVWLG